MTLIGASLRSNSCFGRFEPFRVLEDSSIFSLVLIKSKPEQKPLPAPVKTIQRVSGSLSASTILAESSFSMSRLIAFSLSGLFNVMMAT